MNAGNLKRDFFFFLSRKACAFKVPFPFNAQSWTGWERNTTHHDWEYLSKICKTFYLPQIL